MPITKIEGRESPDKTMYHLRVTVVGRDGEGKKKVFEEGKRIHWVSRRFQGLGFRVYNGLPIEANPSYYFFIVECPLKDKDRTKKVIEEIAEAGGA